MLSERFDRAVRLARELHAGHTRKGGEIPYLAHLLGVASLVLEDGGDEDEAIAALLHDAIEDQGGEPTRVLIEELFGARVASIVKECSDTDEEPKPPWRERKVAYIEHLPVASSGAMRVSLADKLHNARAILADLREIGPDLWDRFNTKSGEDQVWYYEELAQVFERRHVGPMARELRRTVDDLKALVGGGTELNLTRMDRGFVATTPHRVTFGPSAGSPAHTVRGELSTLLAGLRPADGETLHAVFGGAIPGNSDVENQLIYNVFDGASTPALLRGVRFELDDAEPRASVEYRYAVAPAGAPFEHWSEGHDAARWSGVQIPAGPTDHLLSRTWWGLRSTYVELAELLPAGSRFGLRLTVRVPREAGRLTPERLKRLVDGTVSAFQRHKAQAEAVSRIATRLVREPADVASALSDPARAVLGGAEKPIGLTKTDVQWNPDDTRLVAAEVTVETGEASAWEISGRVFAVEAVRQREDLPVIRVPVGTPAINPQMVRRALDED